MERRAVASKIKTLFGIWKLKRPYSILVILLSLFILFQYSLTVFNKQFHGYDDYQTYLAFPEKMIQNGSLGVDPYAETRVVTSLGGKYFLDTFVLTVLPLNSLHIIDSGVAYLILILLVVGILRVWKIQWPLTLFLVFAVSLITAPSGNVTSMVTSIVVFLALCLFLFKEEFWGNSWLKNSLVFALLFSAFFALKSNTIPIAGLLFLGFFAFDYFNAENKPRVLKACLVSGVLAFLFLLPWMLSMYASAHTLLYPLLGKGFHGSAYGSLPNAYSEWSRYNTLPIVFDLVNNLLFWLFLALGIFFVSLRPSDNAHKPKAVLLFALAFLGVLLNSFLTGGYGVYRYSFVSTYGTVIFLIMLLAKNYQGVHSKLKLPFVFFILVLTGILTGTGFNAFLGNIKSNVDKLSFGVKGYAYLDRVDAKIVNDYKAMQSAVPPEETILVRLQFPFLLDFKRNEVYLTDYIGGASPPPGIPLYKGPDALAEYLVLQKVKYVAYSYKSEIGFTREIFSWQLPESGNWRSYNPWLRAEVENTLDFQANLKLLGQTRKRIYDDGEIFVLNLTEPR